ncbi:MAG: hypothetical protein ACR2GR_02000 [Rhodothermales bacterium]
MKRFWMAALVLGTMPVFGVAAQHLCGEEVAAAEEQYLDGQFEAAAQLLSACLEANPLDAPDAIPAYRLLSLSYMNQGNAQGAQQAVEKLLALAPTYEPDPVQDPPSYTVMVLIVKEKMREVAAVQAAAEAEAQKPWFKKRGTWLVVGGGIVAAGVAAVVLGGGAE